MILPAAHYDELFYSVIARTADRMGLGALNEIERFLFGIERVRPSVFGVKKLDILEKRFLPGSPYTAKSIILYHTLIPYFAYFSFQSTCDQIGNGYTDEALRLKKSMAQGTQVSFGLRFCKSCANEDRLEGREPYWRRTHQLPGVKICHLHSCLLSEGSTDLSYAYNNYLSLARLVDEGHPVADVSVNASQGLLERLSKASHEFLIGSSDRSGSIVTSSFVEILEEEGWGHHQQKQNLARRRLIDRILEEYGEDVLGDIGANHFVYRPSLGSTLPRSSTDWLIRCLESKGRMMHPLPYLLIMLALDIPILRLFCEKSSGTIDDLSSYLSRGDQGGPCLNPLCSRFVTPDVNRENSRIAPGSHLIKCDKCGYAYRASAVTGKTRFRRILSYGWVWDQALIEECKTGTSSDSDMRRRFGSCLPNLMRRAIQLGVWHQRWTEIAKRRVEAAEERTWKAQRAASIAKFRVVWLAAASVIPQAGRMEIREREPRAYEVLQKWDQDWLDETTPRQIAAPRLPLDFYSPEDDQSIADRIEKIANRLVDTVPPRRATRRLIMRELFGANITLTARSLSKSRDALRRCVETDTEFKRRCLDRPTL